MMQRMNVVVVFGYIFILSIAIRPLIFYMLVAESNITISTAQKKISNIMERINMVVIFGNDRLM